MSWRTLPHLPLHDDRVWRLALGLLFAVALLVRFGAHQFLSESPVGRMDEWPATESWFFRALATEMVVAENWSVRAGTLHVGPGTAQLATGLDWAEWSGARLPRGGVLLYIAAASVALTNTLALYTMLSLVAGALLPVLGAAVGARAFANRGAGLVAGVLLVASLPIGVASVAAGPWVWEALALGALLWTTLRLADGEKGGAGPWLEAGLVLALAVLVRSIFIWGLVLIPAGVWAARWKGSAACWVALLLPAVVALALLGMRNQQVGGSPYPVVGHAAWDFARTMHPTSGVRLAPPGDAGIMAAGRGRLPGVVAATWNSGEHRAALPTVLRTKLRAMLGGRDEPSDTGVNLDYLRRRSEFLRLFHLRPDVTMAMAWAALVFLLWRRRMPAALLVPAAVLVLHGVLFDPTGLNRVPLHWLGAVLTGGAAVEAMRHARARPVAPLALLTLYAVTLWMLAVDDHGRGTRYRIEEFAWAARIHMGDSNRAAAEREQLDYLAIRRHEKLFRDFWQGIY